MLTASLETVSDTMPRLSRRSFLAASAFLAASPAFADKPTGEDVDVIVIGAGAAGIAAARKLKAERIRVLVFEAQERIGGRCVTDTKTFSDPFDLGAHWIHNADRNPVVAAAKADAVSGAALAECARRLTSGTRCGNGSLLGWAGTSATRIARAGEEQDRCARDECCPTISVRGEQKSNFCSGPMLSVKSCQMFPPPSL